jgi:hypothetical protein
MARPILLACLTLASLLLLVADAAACTCLGVGPACQAFWTTEAVFDATVESVELVTRQVSSPQDGPREIHENVVKLVVRESWKGVEAGPLEVVTRYAIPACGVDFKPGRRYLVFAEKTQRNDGRWTVLPCSSTREFDGTGAAASFLTSLSKPPAGGRVFGSVKLLEERSEFDVSFIERDLEARLRLIGGGRDLRASSVNGRFEFAGLEPGRYRLQLEFSEGYVNSEPVRDLEIANSRACAQQDYFLFPPR